MSNRLTRLFTEPLGPGSGRRVAGAWIESSSYSSAGQPLNAATVSVDGLDAIPADVVVQVNLLDGARGQPRATR